MKVINTFEYLTSSFTLLIYFLIDYSYGVLTIISIIIYLAARAQKVLDTATKLIK
jgi:hypothetical protein